MSSTSDHLKTEVQQDHPSDIMDEEQVQLSLDPKFQVYLAQMSRESGCWTKFFPIPFERASQKSWWDPTFDSEILEDQYKKSAFPHNRFKFRYAICYTIFISAILLFYTSYKGFFVHHKTEFSSILFLILLLYNIFMLLLTYTTIFQRHFYVISVLYAISSVSFSLTLLIVTHKGSFCNCIQLLILIYTLIPMKLYMALTLTIIYSIAFEILASMWTETFITVFTKILSHVAVHIIGLHIYLMSNVRMRQTFMKVGQSLLVRRQLELEKRLKENMIHSLMPPSVAHWLLYENIETRRPSGDSMENNDLKSLFRPFNMDTMNNVSILFADIVGFTKMSSNKSAEELVEILNNLFQRFDDLCKNNYCEKISTLGDCYYCVSGCPKPQPDHALNCVEMGLSMIEAIKHFEQEKHEGINMRVGIHTGTVLCGIVGTRRFKFDVWSNDVSLANKMESTGKPGMVHISEKTCMFLNGRYFLEEGECVLGINTYFIVGRKPDNYHGSFRAEGRQKYSNSLHLFVSPPSSTVSLSPHSRPRVLSCDTTHLKTPQNRNFLSPDSCIMKASSLPSILDSENEQDPPEGSTKIEQSIKTPTSTASSGKYKFKNWKIPKFIQPHRKTSTASSKPDIDIDFVSGATDISEEGGYQQVPTIIESNGIKKKDSVTTLTSNNYKYEEPDNSIDIKSYISHSRSDIGAFDFSPTPEFTRGGSYKSQFGRSLNGDFAVLNRAGSNRSRRGRSPNLESLVPLERARSATVTDGNLVRHKRSFEVPSRLSSIAMLDDYSSHSRKDSGIRSNSRRSSLQIDNRLLNQEMLQHRVSGYYTSSQSSMASQLPPKPSQQPNQGAFFDKYGTCIQNLRKQSDRQLIKCVQDNSKSQSSYFIKPPLSRWTLFFKDQIMEQDYRANVHRIVPKIDTIDTLANSRFNTWVDVLVSIFTFLIVSVSLAIVYGVNVMWLVTFFVASFLQVLNLGLCVVPIVRWLDKLCCFFGRFYRWNLFGGILISLPLILALINIINYDYNHLEVYPIFVGLVHFCNFTQLNCWMKSSLATIISLIFIVHQPLDIVVNFLSILILVWLLNREFEIGYRLSFHTNYIASRDKSRVQYLKNQADYLIYNIVPEHVAEQLKKEAKYSENFKNVAIIFASIVNFNEMYDESFEGGKEFLRVLNELIGDFDELLDKPEFNCIEKIKTIGSTFMAASGLNSSKRSQQQDPNEHLYTLMNFAIAMQQVVEIFNQDLLEFNLIIRIGYNFGDVTAAVIGNTKLYYDIWGDAVNIASRMDSTGVNGRIQVGENCLNILENRFEFEHRGSVYVKGKDNMDVYLLKGRKES
ncbi:unnamed protein product [Ceutorhynchus assimilis]|uniref:Adenylate cyclase type 9 n=1 Tax=Ceutorhynchus assimilis TaxID=467358 RepID=A0A9P0DDX3_9CUCU|nr:unnamed protein product [Ceutorhynchus assimilis]